MFKSRDMSKAYRHFTASVRYLIFSMLQSFLINRTIAEIRRSRWNKWNLKQSSQIKADVMLTSYILSWVDNLQAT